jgi:hypothetical protein
MSDDEARVRARLREYADSIRPVRDVPAAGRTRYRRRVRRQRTAAVLASALAVVAVTAVGVEIARRPDPSHTLQFQTFGTDSTGFSSTVAPSPSATKTSSFTPGQAVSGLPLADTSWISNDEGWALVTGALLHTVDGGTTWRFVSTPPATVLAREPGAAEPGVGCSKDVCVSQVRFADRRNGWLFGRALLTTTDGGLTWTRDPSSAVLALEVAHGRAFRVVSYRECFPPGCAYFVETATVGTSSWQRLAAPGVSGDGVQLLYEGPRLYVAVYGNPAGGADAHIKLLRSLDSGKTWQLRPDPCGDIKGQEVDTSSLAAAPGGFLVALCQPRSFSFGLFVTTSFDAGTTFGSMLKLPLSAQATGGAIAAGSPGSIVVGARDGNAWLVTVSHDMGGTWRTTLSHRAAVDLVVFLGFEDDRTGRVAFVGDRLWTTRDAGDTWTLGRP